MPKFSIIIPCYNSYKYMGKCLETLENQTFKDFEVIIIDDKSTDNSYKELKKYAENSKLSIKLFLNPENLGSGETRNKGIEKACGEYITFLDADDYIEIQALQKINDIINNNVVESIIFNYYHKTKKLNCGQKSIMKMAETGYISKSDALIYTKGSTWGKVYLLEKIKENNIKFPDLKVNEDMVFNKLAMAICEKIYYFNEPLYHYIMQENSLINKNPELAERNAKIGFEIIEKNLSLQFPKEIEAIFVREYLYSGVMDLVSRKSSKEQILSYIKESERKYPNVYKNEACSYLTKFQKIFLYCIKNKFIIGLKALVQIKKIIQKIR